MAHGSLGREERVAAEHAFATSPDGVIVATSTMELGIDVGDLDRVIQIDAPWTVAGFLQRLGRTGRRADAVANCLFLATSERALRDALGQLTAYADGWVEPVQAPSLPLHVLVQQLLALLRQEGALGRSTWSEWLGKPLVLGADVQARLDEIVEHLIETEVLSLDGELLQLGPEAERRFGRRNYLELTGVFADPPTLSVLHGRSELGQVHVRSLLRGRGDGPTVVLIAGRDWRVEHVDWKRRVVHVVPAEAIKGRPRWIGAGVGQSAELARATRAALTGRDPDGVHLSKRAVAAVDELRRAFDWLDDSSATHIVQDPDGPTWWWTFAGAAANAELSARLGGLSLATPTSGLAVRLTDGATRQDVRVQLDRSSSPSVVVSDDMADAYKFADVLPDVAIAAMVEVRDHDPLAVDRAMAASLHTHRVKRGPRP